MNAVQTIEIHAKEVTYEGKKWIACGTKINDVYYKVKFRMTANNQPKERGIYIVTLNVETNMSKQNGKHFVDKNGEYRKDSDILWINNSIEFRKLTEEEMQARNAESMKGVFGE